jgi:hypothetical protein
MSCQGAGKGGGLASIESALTSILSTATREVILTGDYLYLPTVGYGGWVNVICYLIQV